jgi:cell division protein FtsL
MIKNIAFIVMSIAIPFFLFCSVWQSGRYARLETEIVLLEREQIELIAVNRRIISGISVLSAPERIEKVAVEDLAMRKAQAEEITRISLKKGNLGG